MIRWICGLYQDYRFSSRSGLEISKPRVDFGHPKLNLYTHKRAPYVRQAMNSFSGVQQMNMQTAPTERVYMCIFDVQLPMIEIPRMVDNPSPYQNPLNRLKKAIASTYKPR